MKVNHYRGRTKIILEPKIWVELSWFALIAPGLILILILGIGSIVSPTMMIVKIGALFLLGFVLFFAASFIKSFLYGIVTKVIEIDDKKFIIRYGPFSKKKLFWKDIGLIECNFGALPGNKIWFIKFYTKDAKTPTLRFNDMEDGISQEHIKGIYEASYPYFQKHGIEVR